VADRRWGWVRRGAWGGAAIGLIAALLCCAGIPTYLFTMRSLACTARSASGAVEPDWCAGWGRRVDPASTGPVFGLHERAAVYTINLVMAAGGTVAGFPEVAGETLALGWRSQPIEGTVSSRRARCRMGAERWTRVRSSDFAMRSPAVRRAVSLLAARAHGLTEGQTRKLGGVYVEFPAEGGSATDVYQHLVERDSLRVVLALFVPDGAVTATARQEGATTWLDVVWEGGIHYPAGSAFVTGHEAVPVLLDESVFCAMQMDGAFVPYKQQWHWTLAVDDPRLTSQTIERGWFEAWWAGR